MDTSAQRERALGWAKGACLDDEAAHAWERAARWHLRRSRVLLAGCGLGGVTVLAATTWRSCASGGDAVTVLWLASIGTIFTLGFALAMTRAWRAAGLRARRDVSAAKEHAAPARCARCATLVEAHGDAPAALCCARCSGRLLYACGLAIGASDVPGIRRARWIAAARARLAPRSPSWGLWGPTWLVVSLILVVGIWASGRAFGPPNRFRLPLVERERPPARVQEADGRAYATSSGNATGDGVLSRPYAPLQVATQVFARRDEEPYLYFGAIVRVADGLAQVVFADGSTGWVAPTSVFAPELEPDDRIEVMRDGSFVPVTLVERIGPALWLGESWTTVSRVRVGLDAPHRYGAGRASYVPSDGWVEARTPDGWRPGIVVRVDGLTVEVVHSDGETREYAYADTRPQHPGPGMRVRLWGRPGLWHVAVRLGHALAVVDEDGSRSWASLAQVRSVHAP